MELLGAGIDAVAVHATPTLFQSATNPTTGGSTVRFCLPSEMPITLATPAGWTTGKMALLR